METPIFAVTLFSYDEVMVTEYFANESHATLCKEEWIASGCGREASIYVVRVQQTFTPMG